MASAAAAISNLSATATGSLPGSQAKIEPVAGTAKIIHPDDDISLVSVESLLLKMEQVSLAGRISSIVAKIQTDDDASAAADAANACWSFHDEFPSTYVLTRLLRSSLRTSRLAPMAGLPFMMPPPGYPPMGFNPPRF